jgi:hypothetical protein
MVIADAEKKFLLAEKELAARWRSSAWLANPVRSERFSVLGFALVDHLVLVYPARRISIRNRRNPRLFIDLCSQAPQDVASKYK